MKLALLGLTLLATCALTAQADNRDTGNNQTSPTSNRKEFVSATSFFLRDTVRFTERKGFGYDFVATPVKGSKAPFFYSINVPDGNYRITVRLGSKKKAGVTTVRAENRRLFVDRLATAKGQIVEKTFVVNKRTTRISDRESVKIKAREKDYLTWDNKLTLEFNGDAPLCESIEIRPAADSVITVFLCGNSTVVDQSREPWASWGQMIPRFFDQGVCFANYAESGETASSFLSAGRLKKALTHMKPGDYVFIEFGHNDQKQTGPGKGAFYSYMTNLKTFVDEVRAKGAFPVLVTPTARRQFDENGKVKNTHGDYPDAMRWLAAREKVPCIELNGMTKTLYEALGVENSKKALVHYPANTFPRQPAALADNTHFNPYGAFQVAKCVTKGIVDLGLDLSKHLLPEFRSFSPEHPDDFMKFRWDLSPFYEKEKPDGD